MTLIVRAATPDDEARIVSDWLASFQKHPSVNDVGFDTYRSGMLAVIGKLAYGDMLLVAYDDSEPGFICGWLACEHIPPVLVVDYIQAKRALRDAVVPLLLETAKQLANNPVAVTSTHWKMDGAKYDPFLKHRRSNQ